MSTEYITRVDHFMPIATDAQRAAATNVKRALSAVYGGFTEVHGVGSWAGWEEPVTILTVFITAPSDASAIKATHDAIAEEYGRAAGEECVLVVYNNCDPSFIYL